MTINRSEFPPTDHPTSIAFDEADRLALESSRPVDIVDLMQAFLKNPPFDHLDPAICPSLHEILSNSGKIQRLRDQLDGAAMAIPKEINAQNGLTSIASQCLKNAQERQQSKGLTVIAIVAAILSADNNVSRAFARLAPDFGVIPAVIIDELSKALSGKVPGGMLSPQTHLPDRVIPTSDRAFATIHKSTISATLLRLAQCTARQFVVVIGQSGTEIDKIGQLFADRTTPHNPSSEQYTHVFAYNVAHLLLDYKPDNIGSLDYLQKGFEYVASQQGILILDHLELLSRDKTGARDLIVGRLVRRYGPKIVGLYHKSAREEFSAANLGLTPGDIQTYTIPDYSEAHALRAVRDYFMGRWYNWGYALDPAIDSNEAEDAKKRLADVKDDELDAKKYQDDLAKGNLTFVRFIPFAACKYLLLLAEGASSNQSKTTLPYLIVDVAENLISRVRDMSDEEIVIDMRALGRNAINKLDTLINHPPALPRTVLSRYKPVLEEARDVISNMIVEPSFKPFKAGSNRSLRLITQGHLSAEFLGSGLTEFKYPSASGGPPPIEEGK